MVACVTATLSDDRHISVLKCIYLNKEDRANFYGATATKCK